jgi:hypothetical protein
VAVHPKLIWYCSLPTLVSYLNQIVQHLKTLSPQLSASR